MLVGILVSVLLQVSDAPAQARKCAVSDFEVKITRTRWVDDCTTRPCTVLRGTAVLTNKCTIPAGAQIRITGYDAKGQPIETRELWPFSVRNVPPGQHPFSIDQYLKYDREIKNIGVVVVEVKQWRER